MPARYFSFESDFVDSLRCIPMCVRHKLDVAGIKLKLNEWSKLDPAERAYLADMSFESNAEIQGFRDFLSLLVRINCGALPARMEPDPMLWDSAELPAQVAEKALAFGVSVTADAWDQLDMLQRFALVKLSRPGHEGKNFLAALEEFGVMQGE